MNTYNDVILFLNSIYFTNQRILSFIKNDKLESFIDLKLCSIEKLTFLSSEEIAKVQKYYSKFSINRYLNSLYAYSIHYVTILDKNYPERLRNIYNPPAIIFYKGSLKNIENSIAVVGSRKPTEYGLWVTNKIVSELSRYNISIISGLALGIDRQAHLSAINSKSKTIGVVASSIDIQYPKRNMDLYVMMEDQLIVSEYGLRTDPLRRNFITRNRIISGLSMGVLVTEANIRSGSLITSHFATDQAREVFAVPGPINSLSSEGTNDLIRRGAKLVTCAGDILEEFPFIKELEKANRFSNHESLNVDEAKVLNIFNNSILNVSELVQILKIDYPTLYSVLINLEMRGYIEQLKDGYYSSKMI